ncbi:LOW QUALITY PROTEIN: uncharacterized protein J5F26_017374, partial [Ciconia maguari]
MRLELLLFVTGAVAAPGLSPHPLGLLSQEDGGPPKITCFAPRSYAGSTFELFVVGSRVPPCRAVSPSRASTMADFTLDGVTPASRCYWCRYGALNGSAWQMSAFSMEILVNASGDAGCQPPTAAPTGQPLPTSTALWQGTGTGNPPGSAAAPVGLFPVTLCGHAGGFPAGDPPTL